LTKTREWIVAYQKEHPQAKTSWLIEAASLSRNAWYYLAKQTEEPVEMKAKIEAVLLESPYYGYRRVTKELHHQGEVVNHKRIYKIMGSYHLLQQRKSRKPKTTNSNHTYKVYANEVKYLGEVLPYQVWVADITYIPIGTTWAYLALIMDQAGKKIVGWHLDTSLHRSICIEAFNLALRENKAPQYHHSDRGRQYCSNEYIALLKQNHITPSMADVGMSVDNPYAESLNRSIKVEEVYLNAYESFAEAYESIKKYIEVYNSRRLHSSLGYVSPLTFEANYQLIVSKI